MDKSRPVNEKIKVHKRNKEWITGVSKTQLETIKAGEDILTDVLQRGIASADIEYREDLCYDIEALIDYYSPGILKSFRRLFTILDHAENPAKYPEIISYINYLLSLTYQSRKYLEQRKEWTDFDTTSTLESHIGLMWRNRDLLEYKLYEWNTEIIQLSFNSIKDTEKRVFIDKGYWINLKDGHGHVHYTSKTRPILAGKFIKKDDTEVNVLQPHLLFLQPGRVNRRIRWDKAERRLVTSNDLTTILGFAQTNYTEMVQFIKECYRDPLTEQTPAFLIKLHKSFINGDHLVLEDEYGSLLTVTDLPDDPLPTTELLRTILPSQADNCALLVQVNDDIENNLFSVKPLTIVTADRIVRLLF